MSSKHHRGPRARRRPILVLACSLLALCAAASCASPARRAPHARAGHATPRWRSPLATRLPPIPFPALAAPSTPTPPADTPNRIDEVKRAAFEAEAQGDFARAVALHHVLYDEGEGAYDLGSAYARLSNPDAALYFLRHSYTSYEATTEALDRDTNLAMLRNDPRFAALKRYAAQIDEFWASTRHTLVRVTVPTGYERGARLPTLVALHGYLSEPGDFFDDAFWQELADELSIAIVSVSATTPRGPRAFLWTHDVERDSAHVERALASVRGQVAIDRAHVALIGFSQGGDVGFRLLGAHPDRYRGLVSMSPGRLDGAPPLDDLEGDLHGRTLILTVGANEHSATLAAVAEHARLASAHGATVARRTVADQLGHTFPSDLEERLPGWLARIDRAFTP